jgi:MFS family permease
MGRRRPYVLLGGVVGTAGLFLLQFMPSTFALAFMWMLCQFSINLAYAAVTASIPDQCPAYQRGMLSGVNSVAQIVGTVGCLAIAGEFSLLAGRYCIHFISMLILSKFIGAASLWLDFSLRLQCRLYLDQ